MTIRHVLFDADGVLQDIPGGWYAAMEPYLGGRARDFLHETWVEEGPTLAGHGDYLPMLAASLRRWGVQVPVEQVYADVWHRIELIAPSIELVQKLRTAGYGVHLGTNQEAHRAAYMKAELGYDELFDVCCYSFELGHLKPEAEFFVAALDRIGATAGETLFIDDSDPNVATAREVGLTAIRWTSTEGHDVLEARLRDHGLTW